MKAPRRMARVEVVRAGPGIETAKARLLADVLSAFEGYGHPYCVMHGYTGYTDQIPSDVDLVSSDPSGVPRILLASGVARMVQAIEHEAGALRYILHRDEGCCHTFLALDASSDFRGDGRIFLAATEVLGNSRIWKDMRIPAPDVEFGYMLVKGIGKSALTDSRCLRLVETYREAPTRCEWRVRALFPRSDAALIIEACRSEHWAQVRSDLARLRRSMLRRWGQARPGNVIAYWAGDVKRRLRRALHPTGMTVVVLGPDGVGKTSVIGEVARALAPAFRATRQYHLRPQFGRQPPGSGVVVDPHRSPLRNPLLSSAKVAFWLADYYISYFIDILPRLICSTLVLFDRHYWDILVDPRRYRYGGPRWLAGMLSRWASLGTPTVICLDAPEDVILERKREVPREEITRQREAYRRLVERLPRSHVVDAARPLTDVAADVTRIVLDALTARTASRLGLGSTP